MKVAFCYRDHRLVTCWLVLLGKYAEVWIWKLQDRGPELEITGLGRLELC